MFHKTPFDKCIFYHLFISQMTKIWISVFKTSIISNPKASSHITSQDFPVSDFIGNFWASWKILLSGFPVHHFLPAFSLLLGRLFSVFFINLSLSNFSMLALPKVSSLTVFSSVSVQYFQLLHLGFHTHPYLTHLPFLFKNWSIIDLQHYVSSRCTT